MSTTINDTVASLATLIKAELAVGDNGVITANAGLDEKIIAIPFDDPNYNEYHDISELPSHIFSEMRHFFTVYKTLEGKETVVNDVSGAGEAKEVIKKCLDAYIEKFCR